MVVVVVVVFVKGPSCTDSKLVITWVNNMLRLKAFFLLFFWGKENADQNIKGKNKKKKKQLHSTL